MKANVRKYMCVLVVRGTYKKHLFSKRVSFEVSFYYTPIKKKIIDYAIEGVSFSKLGLGQIIGHDISEVETFCVLKGYDFYRLER